jgi:hypothetical protein
MARPYTIRSGAAFLLPDGTSRGAGAVIELDDDVAREHRDKLDPVPALLVPPPAPPEAEPVAVRKPARAA